MGRKKSIADVIKSLPARTVELRENRRGVKRRGIQGRHTKHSVGKFLQLTFEENEHRKPEQKWTNTEIKQSMLKEFADAPDTIRFLTKSQKDPINYYRHRYNSGRLSKKLAPTILSVRYDSEGNAVHARYVERRLTKEDYILLLNAYDMSVIYDEVANQYRVLDYTFFNKELFDSLPLYDEG